MSFLTTFRTRHDSGVCLMTEVGVVALAHTLSDTVVDNLERAKDLAFDESFVREKIGFLKLRSHGASTTSLAQNVVERLRDKAKVDLAEVDCLIVCTQNPDAGGLPNTASTLHGELGLSRDCAAFDISLGCSGYVYGLSIIKSFMDANGLSCGILVTADPYSKIIGPEDRNTALLFGDGATATLLRPGGGWLPGRAVFGSDGKLRSAIAVKDGRLDMNGRQVFVFTSTVVPGLVERALELNGLAKEDIDIFLMHQGSKYIVDELRRKLGVSETALPFGAGETGNLVSSSIPLLLEDAMAGPAKRILVAGFGVGLSWAANILTRSA